MTSEYCRASSPSSNFKRPPSKRLYEPSDLKHDQIGQDWCQISCNYTHYLNFVLILIKQTSKLRDTPSKNSFMANSATRVHLYPRNLAKNI